MPSIAWRNTRFRAADAAEASIRVAVGRVLKVALRGVCQSSQENWTPAANGKIGAEKKPAGRRVLKFEVPLERDLDAGLPAVSRTPQRFENWKERRALALPYFLRSTVRLSRVRKPPFLSTLRRPGS